MMFLNHLFLKIERVREMLCRKVINILNYLIENKIAGFLLLATTGRHGF
jgi:hypothetical protein